MVDDNNEVSGSKLGRVRGMFIEDGSDSGGCDESTGTGTKAGFLARGRLSGSLINEDPPWLEVVSSPSSVMGAGSK